MRSIERAAVAAALAILGISTVAAAQAEEELYAGDFVDREAFPGVAHDILSGTWLEHGDDYLMHVRTTLQPGAAIPASVFSQHWSSTVESGVLTMVAHEGRYRSGKKGPRRTFEAGQTFDTDPNDVLGWENHGLQPVEVRSVVLFDQDHDPITRAEHWARFDDAFGGDVVERMVLRGRNAIDEPYRVVIRDRSGRLVDAWMPTAAESDWAWAGTRSSFLHDVALVAGAPYLPGTRLMVGFWSVPCGPDAVIDIGADLRAIKVIDRYTGGCDASGERHDVALLVRSEDAIEAEEIMGQVVRP